MKPKLEYFQNLVDTVDLIGRHTKQQSNSVEKAISSVFPNLSKRCLKCLYSARCIIIWYHLKRTLKRRAVLIAGLNVVYMFSIVYRDEVAASMEVQLYNLGTHQA